YCQGLTNESILNLKKPQFTLKSLDIGCSPAALVSQLLIFPIAGESLEELTLDLITPETIITILDNCPKLKRLKLANYFLQQPTKIGELLGGLKYLRKLEIFISPKNADYENMILTSGDLPETLDCLILRCGFTTIQLDSLLSRRDLTTLIMDYMYFDHSHFRVIREYAKRSDRLEVLGIGDGGAKDSFAKREWKELKKLCKDYSIRAVPLREINSW
ncbi:7893_t:CDS:1, partial [Acaulospora colombiana]